MAFTSANRAELLEEEVAAERLDSGQALVRAQHSIISSGTEGAGYTDLVREMPNMQGLQLECP